MPLQTRQVINLHKLLVVPVYVAILASNGVSLMSLSTQEYAPAATMLLVCHGLYGFCWIYKDIYYGDKSWKEDMTLGVAFVSFFGILGIYYTPMYCLAAHSHRCLLGSFGNGDELPLIALGLMCYQIGMFFHYGADLQKHVQLSNSKKLLTNNFFAFSRNPNYFGEVMIYLGFAIWSMHWLPLVLFSLVWIGMFRPNMLKKDESLRRYPEFKDWKSKSNLLFPRFGGLLHDFLSYSFSPVPDDILYGVATTSSTGTGKDKKKE